MVIVMHLSATAEQIQAVVAEVRKRGFTPQVNVGETTIVGCAGPLDANRVELRDRFATLPGVESVTVISDSFKLSNRKFHPEPTMVTLNGMRLGDPHHFVVIAGPCSVESAEQIDATAEVVRNCGGHILRGGSWKPRTSPFAFQGLGYAGAILLRNAGRKYRLPTVTEVMCAEHIRAAYDCAGMLQVGARNMQNYPLLTALGRQHERPILLKRGPAAALDELLQAADYLMASGHQRIVLCLRGISPPYGSRTRNVPDIADIAVLKTLTHLPVVFDPSHAGGRTDLVIPLALAAVVAGADGIMVEVHPNPPEALSDPLQQLNFDQFRGLMREVKRLFRLQRRSKKPALRVCAAMSGTGKP